MRMLLRRVVILPCFFWLAGCFSVSTYGSTDWGGSTLVVSPTNVPADGTHAGTVTVTLRQKSLRPIVGVTVSVQADNCTVAPTQAVSDSNGVAVFHITSSTVGRPQLSANLSQGDFKATLPIKPTVNFYLPATDGSSGVAAGAPLDAQVMAPSPNYTGTVHFISTDPNASLPADKTFSASDLGVAILVGGVILHTPGMQTVSAVDVATGQVIWSETYLVVVPAVVTPPQTTVRLSLPSSTVAGTPLTAQVQALDPNGRINPNYQGLVVFSSSDAAARCQLFTPSPSLIQASRRGPMGWCSRRPDCRPCP